MSTAYGGSLQRPNAIQISPIALDTATIYHLTAPSAAPDGLVDVLHADFVDELAEGRTYPQELPMDRAAFCAYFFALDVFVGVTCVRSTLFAAG